VKHKKKCQNAHAEKMRAHYAKQYSRMLTPALFMITHAHTSF